MANDIRDKKYNDKNKNGRRNGIVSNYGFFKSVLKTTLEQHNKMLKGKSSYSTKYEHELKEIRDKLYRSWKYHKELTDKEYRELQSAFDKISFMNLSDQRKGKQVR